VSGAWEVVVGLEVHCQLECDSKLFSACPLDFGGEPNTRTDAYTWGLPGTLPVPNARAVRSAVALGLATGCVLHRESRFARKHYFYPDLPKGYQITQSDHPYATAGRIDVPLAGGEVRRVRLVRIHLEEDAGKTIHAGRASLVDYNRAGAPLVEIVSEPDLRGADEAAAYLRELRSIVRALGISRADMEEGSLRCDANVSLRRPGDEAYGVRCEIKNINSFRFLAAAIRAEVRRQSDLLERGDAIVRSTLGYDGERDRLFVMRSKEDAADYRYMPDPDLPPLAIPQAWIDEVAAAMPELPAARRERYGAHVGADEAHRLAGEREVGDYYDAVVAAGAAPEAAAKWILNEVGGALAARGLAVGSAAAIVRLSPVALADLMRVTAAGELSFNLAKDVLQRAIQEGQRPLDIVEREGLRQVSDKDELARVVDEVVAASPEQVAQYRAGKTKVLGFFVGQVMKRMAGRANPQIVSDLVAAALVRDS
jgi:aspartyl-tRNA(Asn)/glutamyl-tRNA(Gln) amidotransferase subunit B